MRVLAKITNVKEKAYKAANGSTEKKVVVTVDVFLTDNIHIGNCILFQDEPIPRDMLPGRQDDD
jgi:hypothetical protein